MKHMAHTDTGKTAMNDDFIEHKPETAQTLPVPVAPAAPRPSLARYVLPAAFVSQLLAERGHMATQRARYRAPTGFAHAAYNENLALNAPRLPAGYRHKASA